MGEGIENELHQRLQSSAARCYPNASRRFHEQGITQVSFCVSDTGQLADAKLAHTSGSDRLDRAALECVVGGSDPFPAAHGRCFALPVKFGD